MLPVINSGGEVFAAGTFILYFICCKFFLYFSASLFLSIFGIEIDAQSDVNNNSTPTGSDFSVRLALSCLFVSAILHIYLQQSYKPSQANLSMAVALSIILTGFLIIKIRHEKNERLYLGMLDGIIVFQFFCVLIAASVNN
jgi:hypothetical protein